MKMIGVSSDCWRLRIERGGLEPVHDRHAHVEQDDGEVLGHDAPQRGEPGVGLDDRCPSGCEHGPQGEALRRVVVDDQDRTRSGRRSLSVRRSVVERQRRSWSRRVARSRTVAAAGDAGGSHGPMAARSSAVFDGLGHVVVGAGVDAALALAGHDLAGHGDDRERP